MTIILWVVFGSIAGWLLSLLFHTNKEQGFIVDILVGMVGAVIGGWCMKFFGGSPQVSSGMSILIAVLGAIVLVTSMRIFQKSS